MQKKIGRNMHEKENDHKNVNKRDINNQHSSKLDRLLLAKRISNAEEKDIREVRFQGNSRSIRANSKSLAQKTNRLQFKSLVQSLTNTQQYCQSYAHGLLQRSKDESSSLGSFLVAHDVDKNLRARMLDWMIEVTSSYKFAPKTYFASVQLMDRYFKAEEQRLPITRLHIVGVVAMLIATKMDEVYPLKIKTVYDKIVHKKIEKKDLIQMEAKMIEKLGFKLNIWSFYDLALLKLYQNWQLNEQEVLKSIEVICEHIAKFVVFNYQLYGHYSSQVLAESLLKAACKVQGHQRLRLALNGGFQVSRDEQVCTQLILDTVKGFKNSFRSLENIFKFSEASALTKVEQFLNNY